jgi:hypothetical protein
MISPRIRNALVILGYFMAVCVATVLAMLGVTALSVMDGASAQVAGLVKVGVVLAVAISVIHTLVREKALPNDNPETQLG